MRGRAGVSRSIVVIALVAVILIAGASFYLASSSAGSQSESASSSSTSHTGAIPTASPSTVASSSTLTTSSGITSGPDHQLIAVFYPSLPLITQFLTLNYTLSFSAIGTVPSILNISVSAPEAIGLSLTPDQITEPGLTIYQNATVTMRPSPSLAAGLYPVTVQATGGGVTYTETLQVQVIKYLIVTLGTNYEPSTYTVPVNTTVTWLRLNPGGSHGLTKGDIGLMDFDIPSLNATGRPLLRFQTESYTFTKPGTYPFHCDFHPGFMNGVITVIP